MEANTNLPGIGDRLANRYRIMFGRGAGPSGAVFKALDLENDLSVALKVFNSAYFDGPFAAMNIARLSRASEIEDPNVVKVYDFVSSEGRHFVTSQLVEGLSLRAVLDLHDEGGEHFPVPKLKSFGERMLNGVRAFHRKGLVHGNIKPENFFVLPDRLALSDPWQLVDRKLRDGEHIPVSDYYRAPEQLTDPTIEIPQSDLYAVGLILGELIAISPVKPGLALSTQVPRLTKRFDELFVTATALDPNQRFDSIESFATCMREAFSNVQKEGLWVRRMHETGSFRAIRLPAAEGPEVEPLADMPVESLIPEKKVAPAGDLMDIQEAAEPMTDDFADDGYEQASEAIPELPEPEPVIPEADDEGVVTFESVTSREDRNEKPIAGMQKSKGRGKKGGRPAAQQPAPVQAPQPAMVTPAAQAARTVTQPQRPVQPPPMKTSQSFRSAPPPVPPSRGGKKPVGLILLGLLIVVLLVVTAIVLTRGRNQTLTQGEPAVAAAPVQSPAPVAAAVPEPVPAPAVAPAPAPAVAPAPAPAPAAVAAPAPAPVPALEPVPEPPKPAKMADMLMCGSSAQILIVTDPNALNGSGKKPSDVAFCVDKQEYMEGGKPVGGMNLTRAKAACRKMGKTVCSAKQWQAACSSGKADLQNMVGGHWEVATDGRVHGGAGDSEGASCGSSDKRFQAQSTDGTRCCSAPEYKL